jgi:hypothetical protein
MLISYLDIPVFFPEYLNIHILLCLLKKQKKQRGTVRSAGGRTVH